MEKMSFRWMMCVIFEEHMCGLWYYLRKKKVGFELDGFYFIIL